MPIFSETTLIFDHNRLSEAKTAHHSVLGKVDPSLAKKPLTTSETTDTKALIAKLDEVAESADLDVSTLLALPCSRQCTLLDSQKDRS